VDQEVMPVVQGRLGGLLGIIITFAVDTIKRVKQDTAKG